MNYYRFLFNGLSPIAFAIWGAVYLCSWSFHVESLP